MDPESVLRTSVPRQVAQGLQGGHACAEPADPIAVNNEQVRGQRLAAAAFDAVSCEGLARVDFFCTPDGEILLNEINTIPGMTAASYFPKMWEATGLPVAGLIDRLLSTALLKRPGLR